MASRVALVLMSGGAKAAYQAGVLDALADILKPAAAPFAIYTGVSAGALNASFMAMHADQFSLGTRKLVSLWNSLCFHDVFESHTPMLVRRGLAWLAALTLGGLGPSFHNLSLLDTSPLQSRVQRLFDAVALKRHFESGALHALGLTATQFPSGTSVTFFDGHASLSNWQRINRVGVRRTLGPAHLLASSAIPLFFPAMPIDGTYFGDGAIRMTTPLSPAIHLGAEALLAIALHPQEAEPMGRASSKAAPTLAQLGGLLMNALFFRTLDADAERLLRINETLKLIPQESAERPKLRPLKLLILRPTRELSTGVRDIAKRFPALIQHLLKGLGADDASGSELLSYLAFEPEYTQQLISWGREDTLQQSDKILSFFEHL